MKRLKDGGLAFYPGKRLNRLLSVFFLFMGIMIWRTLPHNGFVYVFLTIWSAGLSLFFKQGFFPAPVCVVYPEKIEWNLSARFVRKKQTLFWDDIQGIYTKEDWVRNGKHSMLLKRLVFRTRAWEIDGTEIILKYFYRIPNRYKQPLLNEITARGIALLPEELDKKVPKFLKDIWSKLYS